MLGDVTDGYVNESADKKYLSIAAFKRGFAKEIENEKKFTICVQFFNQNIKTLN